MAHVYLQTSGTWTEMDVATGAWYSSGAGRFRRYICEAPKGILYNMIYLKLRALSF